jgi:hypothetical protein
LRRYGAVRSAVTGFCAGFFRGGGRCDLPCSNLENLTLVNQLVKNLWHIPCFLLRNKLFLLGINLQANCISIDEQARCTGGFS